MSCMVWAKTSAEVPKHNTFCLVAFDVGGQFDYLIGALDENDRWYDVLAEAPFDRKPDYWAAIVRPIRRSA